MMYAEMLYEIFIDILHITLKANYYVILYIEYNFSYFIVRLGTVITFSFAVNSG